MAVAVPSIQPFFDSPYKRPAYPLVSTLQLIAELRGGLLCFGWVSQSLRHRKKIGRQGKLVVGQFHCLGKMAAGLLEKTEPVERPQRGQ